MTRRERVLRALSHRDTHPIPWQIDLTLEERRKLAARIGEENIDATLGNHITGFNYDGLGWEPVREGYVRDMFGVVWNRTIDRDIGVVDRPPLDGPTLDGFAFPPVLEEAFRSGIEDMLETAGDRYRSAGIGFSLFERAWTLRGMEALLVDMVENPDFVDALLDAIVEYDLRALDIALEYDIDGVYFGDDWGQQNGLIMGPRFWRRFLKPRLARLYDRARSAGKVIVQHSCGDIREIYPDLVEIGLSCHQTFQPEIYDAAEVKRLYGGKLAIWGGISTQRLLPYASPSEVKAEARRLMAVLGAGGGYIAAPTHAVPGDVPVENVLAMVEVFEGQ